MCTIQSQKSIMVVDDDPSVQQVVARSLKGRGYRVRTASSGAEALRLAGLCRYDLMFLDIKMPGMSGLEVLRKMAYRHPSTIVVMLTADKSVASKELSNQGEAFAYLTKPCGLSEVTDIADSVLVGA